MARLILILAVATIGLLLWYKFKTAKGKQRDKLVLWTTIGAVGAVLLFLGATGHLTWLGALIGGAIAMVPRILPLIKYLPLVSRFRQQPNNQSSQQQSADVNKANSMNREQAYEVLGLKAGASKEEIIAAHKRMMQKVHPDRGGSDFLAAQINQAKDILLA